LEPNWLPQHVRPHLRCEASHKERHDRKHPQRCLVVAPGRSTANRTRTSDGVSGTAFGHPATATQPGGAPDDSICAGWSRPVAWC